MSLFIATDNCNVMTSRPWIAPALVLQLVPDGGEAGEASRREWRGDVSPRTTFVLRRAF